MVLDDEPILNAEQIKLALFMRERFFCTVYDAVRAMLPAGLWFNDNGGRRVKDKTIEMVRLAIAGDACIEASDFEFHLPRPSYTINTLDALENAFPGLNFF